MIRAHKHVHTHTDIATGLSSFHTPVATLLLLPSKLRTRAHARTQTGIPLCLSALCKHNLRKLSKQYLLPFISRLDSIFSSVVRLSLSFLSLQQAHSSTMLLCCMRLSVCLLGWWEVGLGWSEQFTVVRAGLKRRRSAASPATCWRYVTAPSCCRAAVPPC